MKPTRGEQRRARHALLRQTVTVAFALLLAKRPNVAFGASNAPNVAFGALDATNATLGRSGPARPG
ncbi:hypothetical protein [Amycolatopsis sp.]|uniref:hypothetical protein n=1 Tax=Amycolatopsis sp. TaxID=37632 RepID=UPI002D7F9C0A|nr:hypothetical protein [Amycolatopsis sp.]HET6705564.1 hypothetical protein [Amycolatopsis sp.]